MLTSKYRGQLPVPLKAIKLGFFTTLTFFSNWVIFSADFPQEDSLAQKLCQACCFKREMTNFDYFYFLQIERFNVETSIFRRGKLLFLQNLAICPYWPENGQHFYFKHCKNSGDTQKKEKSAVSNSTDSNFKSGAHERRWCKQVQTNSVASILVTRAYLLPRRIVCRSPRDIIAAGSDISTNNVVINQLSLIT